MNAVSIASVVNFRRLNPNMIGISCRCKDFYLKVTLRLNIFYLIKKSFLRTVSWPNDIRSIKTKNKNKTENASIDRYLPGILESNVVLKPKQIKQKYKIKGT
jgi:hypothetical protein